MDDRDTIPPVGPGHPERPTDWSQADAVLQGMIEREERQIRRNNVLIATIGVLVALVIAALVLSVLALNRDIESVAEAEPKDDSVGTAALQSGAVTSDKLAAEAVGPDQLADGAVTAEKLAESAVTETALAQGAVVTPSIANGAVGPNKLAAGAVDGTKVAPDSLTGENIDEATLETVAEATLAETATQAEDALALGGAAAAAYLSSVRVVQEESRPTLQPIRGPIVARCPNGTRVIGGGAAVAGTSDGVAIVRSAPDGEGAWTALAEATAEQSQPWSLVVTAICAAGGEQAG
jgi:hypothetical protein